MLNKFINKSIFFIHTSLGTTGSLLHDGSPVVVDVVLLEGGGHCPGCPSRCWRRPRLL